MTLCEFDWTIRLADLLTVFALFAGPIIAVRIADSRQRRHVERDQKEWIFRTLITTKSSPLAPDHINAINFTGLMFREPDTKEKDVIEAWKLYRAHLDKGTTADPGWWVPKQMELLDDLLYKIGLALQVPLTVSEIKTTTSYYPAGLARAELETNRIRQLWLEVLENYRALPTTNELTPRPPEARQSQNKGAAPSGQKPSPSDSSVQRENESGNDADTRKVKV